MADRKSLVELKKMVLVDIEITQKLIESYGNTEHPQEKETLNQYKGEIDALKNVLEYCNYGVNRFKKMKDWEDVL